MKFLRESGFHVADDARANYPQTVHTLASALNMRYLPELIGPADRSQLTRRSLGDLIRSNAFMRAFSSAGYDVRFYRSEYDLIRPADAEAIRGPGVSVNEFDFAVYESTVLPQLSRLAGLTPQKISREGSLGSGCQASSPNRVSTTEPSGWRRRSTSCEPSGE